MLSDVAAEPHDPEMTEPSVSASATSSTPAASAPDQPLVGTSEAPSLDVTTVAVGSGEACWLSVKSPTKAGPNEDAVAAIPLEADRGLLLVADGLGGHRGGRRASQLIRKSLSRMAARLRAPAPPGNSIVISQAIEIPCPVEPAPQTDHRSAILNEIERVNQRLLRGRVGAATTLALIEIDDGRVRSYHIGDTEILIVSQRGRIKYATVSHSPVGYGVHSGLLTEEEALAHPERHVVSNVIGTQLMSVEIGAWMNLSARDTVLLASDGLFDNLLQSEIVEMIRKGPLDEGVRNLAVLARERMQVPQPDHPSKPDDLTILAYRETNRKPSRRSRKKKESGGTP